MSKDAVLTTTVKALESAIESPTSTKDGKPLASSELSGSEEGGYATEKNPFADPEAAEHWRLVYEKSQYECRHAFDPSLTWTEEEEKRLVRKLDWRICLWAVSPPNYNQWAITDEVNPVHHVFCTPGRPRKSRPSCLG
jgi:hypothetical protein